MMKEIEAKWMLKGKKTKRSDSIHFEHGKDRRIETNNQNVGFQVTIN